jgi:hypothetical protein
MKKLVLALLLLGAGCAIGAGASSGQSGWWVRGHLLFPGTAKLPNGAKAPAVYVRVDKIAYVMPEAPNPVEPGKTCVVAYVVAPNIPGQVRDDAYMLNVCYLDPGEWERIK